MTRSTRTLVSSIAACCILASAGAARAVPGQWSVPAPVYGNGFLWAPAPPGGSGSPANLLALRLQADGGPSQIVVPQGVDPTLDGLVTYPFPYGAVSLELPANTSLAGIDSLSFSTYYESGVTCGGGSPRAALGVDTNGDAVVDGYVSVYAGAYPNFSGCATGVWTSNDLLDGAKRWDSTQLGGPFYGDKADAIAAAGASATVLRVVFVWDSSWQAPFNAVLWLDDLRVNDFVLAEPGYSHACSLAAANVQPVCP